MTTDPLSLALLNLCLFETAQTTAATMVQSLVDGIGTRADTTTGLAAHHGRHSRRRATNARRWPTSAHGRHSRRRATHGGRHARPAHSQGEESTFGKGADTRTETAGRGGGHRDSQLCCTAHRKPGGGMPGGGIIPGRNPGGGMPGGGMPGLQAARQRAGQRAQGTSAPHPKRDARIAQCPVTSERHDQLRLHTLLQQAEHTLLVLFSLLTPEAPPLSVTLRQATPLA